MLKNVVCVHAGVVEQNSLERVIRIELMVAKKANHMGKLFPTKLDNVVFGATPTCFLDQVLP